MQICVFLLGLDAAFNLDRTEFLAETNLKQNGRVLNVDTHRRIVKVF